MEVALSDPQILSEPLRRGAPLPLSQLVESRSRSNIPKHLLESKIYAKLKSNSLIQAEPPELHFRGFEPGKGYVKSLKIINISSEVMNIHIIPTQTKHFETTYTKKYRLIPGLAYALKIRFRPDEWRYFYDSVRIHCKGEDNLLIPVHAYPVIDDLHIPPHIDLSAVPLGQSVCQAIPLRCSCPIDFEFQVFVIQPHEAFSISPLTGVIPANGEVNIIVTFRPFQYETSQVTIQLIISQFNTKPYLCTITGRSAPYLARSEFGRKPGSARAVPADEELPSPAPQVPQFKTKNRSTKAGEKSKVQTSNPGLKPPVDVCTHAGVAKMLIKNTDKHGSKDREASFCGSLSAMQKRKIKEAHFMKKVRQNVKEEQANRLRGQVRLGEDPVSEDTRRQIAEERDIALNEYMVKRGEVRDEDFAAGQQKPSSKRVLVEAGQACEGVPSFQFHDSFQQERRQRALTLFQQAARKVVIRCRMNRRLACLKKLSDSLKNVTTSKKDEMTSEQRISPDRVFPFAFPIFQEEDDLLAHSSLDTLPVDSTDVTVTTCIPFFSLQAPQHYKLMDYRPLSAWEAFNSYSPTTLARPLRTAAPDHLVHKEPKARDEQQHDNKEEDVTAWEAFSFTSSAPETLLRPFPANPLRIFNPAPGLHSYKTTPKYLESDLEFHLCPMPRYTIPESKMADMRKQTSHTQKTRLDRQEVIRGLITWKNFDLIASYSLSNKPAHKSDRAPHRSVAYNTDILTEPPPPLTGPQDDLDPLKDEPYPIVQLTPEMIKAEFLPGKALVSKGNLTSGRHRGERQAEASHRSEFNQMGRRVMTRLKQLVATDRNSEEACGKTTPTHSQKHTSK
uniref:cilia- and flagella-associated protein 221 n=1 Tax=Semicossyphus pulcher TaxID=241346 RepID=UPI0037E83F04